MRPPAIDGVSASRIDLPVGPWPCVLDALCALFPAIDEARWRKRFADGRILDADGQPLPPDAHCTPGLRIHYYREVVDEPPEAPQATVLYRDDRLLVVDKPHFLPVTPAGRFVRGTVLAQLVRQTGIRTLVPMHRIDRATAGLVMFSCDPASHDAYQSLFRTRSIHKQYEAIAPALPDLAFPRLHRSRLTRGTPFFRMQDTAGDPNSETRIDVIARGPRHWHYALVPKTGRKHQLRIHMATLGAPILNDPLYPDFDEPASREDAAPLQLLAKALSFVDPLDGRARHFESRLALQAVT